MRPAAAQRSLVVGTDGAGRDDFYGVCKDRSARTAAGGMIEFCTTSADRQVQKNVPTVFLEM